MRTIKFLGLAATLAATAVPALAQGAGALQPGAFPALDRLAAIEANRLVHRQQMRQWQGQRAGQPRMNRRLAQAHGFRGLGPGRAAGMRGAARAGVQAGVRAGVRAGYRAGLRAERLANATPEQKAFVEQLRAQRQAVHAQVVDGKLTREQARTQMQKWVTEHRPKK